MLFFKLKERKQLPDIEGFSEFFMTPVQPYGVHPEYLPFGECGEGAATFVRSDTSSCGRNCYQDPPLLIYHQVGFTRLPVVQSKVKHLVVAIHISQRKFTAALE